MLIFSEMLKMCLEVRKNGKWNYIQIGILPLNITKFQNLKISLLNEFPDIIRNNLLAYCMQIALILRKL